MRDEFYRQGSVDATKVNLNLACTVYAWKSIAPELVKASFKVTGTFPFQRNFTDKYKWFQDEQNDRIKKAEERFGKASTASRLPSVGSRRSGQLVFKKVMTIISSSKGVSTKLQEVQTILKQEESVESILMDKISHQKGKTRNFRENSE